MIWVVAIGLLVLFSIMARMIYVLVRDREHSFKWTRALERAIYDAGWIKEYERACQAASESLAVECKTVEKLSATKLALKHNTTAAEIQRRLVQLGYIEVRTGIHYFTDLGRSVGGEYRKNHAGASFTEGHMVWPVDLPLANIEESAAR